MKYQKRIQTNRASATSRVSHHSGLCVVRRYQRIILCRLHDVKHVDETVRRATNHALLCAGMEMDLKHVQITNRSDDPVSFIGSPWFLVMKMTKLHIPPVAS